MSLRERAGVAAELANSLGRSQVNDVHDQRIEARPALRFVDAGDGFGVRGIRREPVDRLGRNCDRLSVGDQPGSFPDCLVVQRQYAGGLGHAAAAIGAGTHHQVERA